MSRFETEAIQTDDEFWARVRGTLKRRRAVRRSRVSFRDVLAGPSGDEIKAMLEQA
jgi:hypothetical protein